MKLLGISGGPDSMLLLNKYKKRNIVVAHINYNVRQDSYKDEKTVSEFCKKNNIIFELLSIENKKTNGNFQSWAREIRFNFFEKIYKKHNCNKLLLAHHKDDFLETALFQKETKREVFFFGIKKNNYLKNMNIFRPFINKYWKNEIIKKIIKKKIPFVLDSSNEKPTYKRNQIRIELKKYSKNNKKKNYKFFQRKNKKLISEFKKINKIYWKWQKTNFNCLFFLSLLNFQEKLIFLYIHLNCSEIKIFKNKTKQIINFIKKENNLNKKFKLNNEKYIQKNKKNELKLYNFN